MPVGCLLRSGLEQLGTSEPFYFWEQTREGRCLCFIEPTICFLFPQGEPGFPGYPGIRVLTQILIMFLMLKYSSSGVTCAREIMLCSVLNRVRLEIMVALEILAPKEAEVSG